MKKVINFISKRYNVIVAFILGGIVFGTSAYAITVASNTITYDNTNSGLTSTNVQSAIDEVYTKANSCNISLKELGNSNIVSVKKYDETSSSSTYCVTGNEATCQTLAPAKTGTYAKGTIIDYKVNGSTTRTFYVLHDDGVTLTLQDQKNIVDYIPYVKKTDFITDGGTETEWNSCTYTSGETYVGCNTRGPLTILSSLESATNGWTNVNLQTYTPGVTNFAGNNKTGCTESACNRNTYTMTERSGRARLITVPETWQEGCEYGNNQSCPKYMYNYLSNSSGYGGINEGGESWGYWTMNARAGGNIQGLAMTPYGYVGWAAVETNRGGRAVVEIDK